MAEPRRCGGGFQVGDAVVRAGANGPEGQGHPLPARHPADDSQRGVETSGASRRRVGDEVAQEGATVARAEEKLKLGKGAAFVKGRLKRLRQEDETWEADFQALPKPITQSETHYLGWSWPRTARSWPIPTLRAGPRSTIWPPCWPTPCGDR